MQHLSSDSVNIHIAARPETGYALITDIQQMASFSPELVSCRWLDGATGPAVGARFEAVNKVPASRPWKNRPVVVTHNPPDEFAISRTEPFAGTVVWRYQVQSEESGTHLIESYEVTRPITRLGWLIIEKLFHGDDRRSALRTGMIQTLERVKEAAERVETPTIR